MMMALGLFVFSIPTAAYQTLERQTSWRHATNSRVGARAHSQYIGPGEDTISLDGWIAPMEIGSEASLMMLRDMADTGKAWTLVDGRGFFHGVYTINSMREGRSVFTQSGAARKIEFSLSLNRVDDNLVDKLLGDLSLPTPGSMIGGL